MENISTDKPWVEREQAEKYLVQKALEKRKNYVERMRNSNGSGAPPEFPIIGPLTEENKGSLVKAIETRIADPRKAKGVRYGFVFLMLAILVASCCKMTGPTDIAHFVMFNFDIFGEFFKTVPSHDTFRRILMLINPNELGTCLQLWLYSRFPVEIARDPYGRWMMHIDGKAILACAKKSKGESPIYFLDVLIDGLGILTLVFKVDAKHNEQAEIPNFLKEFPDNNAVITADAGGTYNNVVKTIIDKHWEYFLSLKKNQKNLYNAIWYTLLFYDGKKHESLEGKTSPVKLVLTKTYTIKQKEHGGWNTYSVQVIWNAQELIAGYGLTDSDNAIYTHTKSIAIITTEREREVNGKIITTTGVRYYISSIANLEPETALLYRRNHWNLEAKHRTLDVDLDEDRHTSRVEYAPINGDILRRFAVSMRDSNPSILSALPYRTYFMGCTFNVPAILRQFLYDK